MATLTISRESAFADRLRAYAVMLDGKKIGDLGNGETKSFVIEPGQHTLALKIDWCGSPVLAFTASDNTVAFFRASTNLKGIKIFFAIWYVLFERNAYLQLQPSSTH